MSAEQVVEPVNRATTPKLRLVETPVARVSTLGFVGIVLTLIAIGLTSVMLVSTTVSAQSQELSSLRQEAQVLGYEADGLESDYQRVISTNALALRAAELGLVPNPYPAFVHLGDNTILGEPTPVTGDEMPFLRGVASQTEPLTVTGTEDGDQVGPVTATEEGADLTAAQEAGGQ